MTYVRNLDLYRKRKRIKKGINEGKINIFLIFIDLTGNRLLKIIK